MCISVWSFDHFNLEQKIKELSLSSCTPDKSIHYMSLMQLSEVNHSRSMRYLCEEVCQLPFATSTEGLVIMDSNKKEQKTKGRFSEILRSLFYVVMIVFLLSCIVFLFLDHLQTKERLAVIDDKMNTFELTLKKVFPTSPTHTASEDNRLDAAGSEGLHVRLRRALTSTVSLQSLEKRLNVLEFR